LETRLAAAAKLNWYDAPEKARYLDDLRRFSWEMPDAPHLMEVFQAQKVPHAQRSDRSINCPTDER
jgi:hypothetical protein